MIGKTFGSYEVVAKLGQGGMGEVYRARDARLGRDVAIKILPPQFNADPDRVSRFDREARALAALNHPNIASIYGLERDGDVRAFVLELVEGPTLSERIARGPMPVAEALPVARQIADAIEAAHERGIIHRDLKPANVKLSATGAAKVLDFGLAKTEAAVDDVTALNTEAGAVLGTAAYMSPEQARGVVDKRTDVWAFGCLLFEMLTGKPAFREATWIETLTAIATREPDYSLLPNDVPPPIRQLIERCLQKDPRLRLRDIGEARIALDMTTGQVAAAPAGRAPSRTWVAIGAALVVLAAGVFALWRWPSSAPAGERMEFVITPPSGVSWGELPEDPWPRISPNGAYVLYAARSANGAPGLWVRDILAVKERLLPDTQDAPLTVYTFWSADSRTVGYCRNNQLKLVDLGGQPSRVIDAPNCVGNAAWNERGEILYSTNKGLFKVLADGTGTVQVTTTTAAGELHWLPQWLPDGRRFIYGSFTLSKPGGGETFLGSTDSHATPKRVLSDVTMAEYVIAGGRAYLVFVRTGTLLAQPVDPSTLAGLADPVPIATRIAVNLFQAGPFSATGSVLAYRSGSSFPDATLAWMDRSGNRVGRAYAENTPVDAVALSHDEKTIAFGRYNRDNTTIEMWTADVARGTEQLVFAGPGYVSEPVFSADDRTIAVANSLHVATISLAGASAPVNLNDVFGLVATTWSAESKTILASGLDGNIYRLDLSQTPAKLAKVHAGAHPALSPDGRWLAYDLSVNGTPQIEVEKYPEGTPKARVSRNGGFQPKWRSNGAELFFLTSSNDLMSAQIHTDARSDRLDVAEPVRLFRTDFHPDGANFVRTDYAVSRDGQRFLVRLTDGAKPLTVVRNWVLGLK